MLLDLDIIRMMNCFKGESSKHPVFFFMNEHKFTMTGNCNKRLFLQKKGNASTE